MLLRDWLKAERGRGRALADHLGVRQPSVSDWACGKAEVPVLQCPAIELFTARQVTCEELRPDKAEYFATLKAWADIPITVVEANQPQSHAKACVEAIEIVVVGA